MRLILTRYISYLFSYIFILLISGLAGAFLCWALTKISPEIKFFGALVGVSINIAFLIALLLIFSLCGLSNGSSIATFFLYLLFSFLNSKTIMDWIFGSDKIAEIISTLSPSVLWLQNEWLRYAVEWGFSDKFWQHLLNVTIYLFLFLFLLSYRIKKYECKA